VLLHLDQLTLQTLSLGVHHLVMHLLTLNHLVLVLDDRLDAEAAHEPVVLKPFLKLQVSDFLRLVTLADAFN
jgi:hypothetical protein